MLIVAERCFKCEYLEKRLAGLTDIKVFMLYALFLETKDIVMNVTNKEDFSRKMTNMHVQAQGSWYFTTLSAE